MKGIGKLEIPQVLQRDRLQHRYSGYIIIHIIFYHFRVRIYMQHHVYISSGTSYNESLVFTSHYLFVRGILLVIMLLIVVNTFIWLQYLNAERINGIFNASILI